MDSKGHRRIVPVVAASVLIGLASVIVATPTLGSAAMLTATPTPKLSHTVRLPLVMSRWCKPHLSFTHVQAYGSADDLCGRAACVEPEQYRIAVYIYVSGWWNKPYWTQPLTPINADGTWTCDITTGGYDQQATQIAAFLVPSDFEPPILAGVQTLPETLWDDAVDSMVIERQPIQAVTALPS